MSGRDKKPKNIIKDQRLARKQKAQPKPDPASGFTPGNDWTGSAMGPKWHQAVFFG
jgi:hypothetical protein